MDLLGSKWVITLKVLGQNVLVLNVLVLNRGRIAPSSRFVEVLQYLCIISVDSIFDSVLLKNQYSRLDGQVKYSYLICINNLLQVAASILRDL